MSADYHPYYDEPSAFSLSESYLLPLERHFHGEKAGKWRMQDDGRWVITCYASEFLLEEADKYRPAVWRAMSLRHDLRFMIIVKRIHRLPQCLPEDWGEGYDNVALACSVEDQRAADERLPLLAQAVVKHKMIVAEPLLSPINLRPHLAAVKPERLTVGGESGPSARVCCLEWVLDLHRQSLDYKVPFWFKQTGSNFVDETGQKVEVHRSRQSSLASDYELNNLTL
jgi:protein gp37